MILSPVLRPRYFDANGNPLAGGKLYTYAAGTTTPQATYSNSTGTANANPVILDANGEASLWIDPAASYKFVLKDSNDVLQWSVDNASGLLADGVVTTAKLADLSVTTAKLADLAVTSAKIANDASIDANRAVNTNHIRDSAVTAAKMAANSVATANIIDGAVATAKLADGAVTPAKRASLGHQVSSAVSLQSDNTADGLFTDITNCSITITTTGRPVLIFMQPSAVAIGDGGGSVKVFSSGTDEGSIRLVRDSTSLACFVFGVNSGAGGSRQTFTGLFLDAPAAGTYVYKYQFNYSGSGGGQVDIRNLRVIAFEL